MAKRIKGIGLSLEILPEEREAFSDLVKSMDVEPRSDEPIGISKPDVCITKKPSYDRLNLENQAKQFIILAELFGSGKRDATGYITTSNFIANREGVKIDFYDESSSMHIDGKLEVTLDQKVVLAAERSIESYDFKVGLTIPLGYQLIIYDPVKVEEALNKFQEGLKLLGYSGMQAPL